MDCEKCCSKEDCEYRKNGEKCPYEGFGMDDFFLNWDGSSGNL